MNHSTSTAKQNILLMLVLVMMLMATRAWSLVLVEDGVARCTIVVARENQQILDAAEDLQNHLRKMSGAEVPLVHDANALGPGSVGIYIDVHPLEAPGRGRMIDRQALWPDGYVIEVAEFDGKTGLFLSSPRPEGVSHAVYGLLEDYLGCHWFTPGKIGVFIPRRRTVELDLPVGLQMVKPDFEKRQPWYNDNALLKLTHEENRHYQKWLRRNRVGDSVGDAGHGWKYVFKERVLGQVDEDGDGISDLAPFFNGRRQPNVGGVCMSHPKATEIASDWFIRFFNGRPDFDYFSFGQSDAPCWCRCDACLAMASNDGARMLLMSNRVAANLAKVHPNKRITIMPYKETLEPPQQLIRAHPNLIPVIVSLGKNQISPKPENTDYRQQVERWMTMLPLAWSRDYVGATNGPWPLFETLQKNHDFYRGLGYTGVMNEYLSRNLGTDVHMWLNCQLAWDGRRRVTDLLDIFYPAYFGAAATDMRNIYERIEQHMIALGGSASLMDAPQYYPVDLLKKTLETIAKAKIKANGSAMLLARIKRDENCLRATLLWVYYQAALSRANEQRHDRGREEAVMACRAYLDFITGLEGKLTMGGKARTLAEWMLKALTGLGTYFDRPGLQHHWDNFDYGGKAYLARNLKGFHFEKHGLYLKPWATGELIYEFRVDDGLRFKEVFIPGGPGGYDLAIDMALPPDGSNSIEVSRDQGKTWITAYKNFQNPGDVIKFDLTRYVGGSSRFLLKFQVRNTHRKVLALDCLTIMLDVE